MVVMPSASFMHGMAALSVGECLHMMILGLEGRLVAMMQFVLKG